MELGNWYTEFKLAVAKYAVKVELNSQVQVIQDRIKKMPSKSNLAELLSRTETVEVDPQIEKGLDKGCALNQGSNFIFRII